MSKDNIVDLSSVEKELFAEYQQYCANVGADIHDNAAMQRYAEIKLAEVFCEEN